MAMKAMKVAMAMKVVKAMKAMKLAKAKKLTMKATNELKARYWPGGGCEVLPYQLIMF